MAKITSPQMVKIPVKNQQGEQIQVWKIEDYIEYLRESFSFPEGQGLPKNRFEENTITVSGPKGTGKSTFVRKQLAPYLKSLWREKIDFFDAQDIFGTIEAIAKSKKLVHFICFEDAMREGFDKRTAMHRSTKLSGQLYEVIRHSQKEGYMKAGYIIICIITQLYDGIDFRYLEESAFDVFKAHCRGVEKKIKNEQVISDLKYWKDKSRRAKDIRYRKLGYLADSTGNVVRVFDISEHLKVDPGEIEWIKVERSPLKLKHIQMVVDWLLKHDDILMSEDKDFIFGHLYDVLDKMKIQYDFFQVGSSDFKEIYIRAKVQYLTQNQEQLNQEERVAKRRIKRICIKQYRNLQQYLFSNKDLMQEKQNILLSYLSFRLRALTKRFGVCTVSNKELKKVILDVQGLIHKQTNIKPKISVRPSKEQVIFMHDTLKMSFKEISIKMSVPRTTLQDWYRKIKEIKENEISEMIQNILEVKS